MTTDQSKQQEFESEVITAASYIATLLQRLVSEHLLVDAVIPAVSDKKLTTTLLQVMPAEGVFLLDDLFPQPAPEAVTAGSKVRIGAAPNGARMAFETEIESVQEEGGLRTFRLQLPTAVKYWQAREEHRVTLESLDIPVSIEVEKGTQLKGRLHDVSTLGMNIRLSQISGLKREKVYRCTIDHSDDEAVEVEITPTRVEKAGGELPIQLGIRLMNMSRHDSQAWRQFVAELERRLLRMKS